MDPTSDKKEIIVEHRPQSNLGQFAAKAFVVGVVAILCSWIISEIFVERIGNLVDERVLKLEQKANTVLRSGITGTGFFLYLENELARVAAPNHELTSEQKQRILSHVRIIADKWRPFLTDVSTAVVGSSATPPAKKE